MLDCLDTEEALGEQFTRVSTFTVLRNAQDFTEAENQAAMARVNSLGARLGASFAFVEFEILQMPNGKLEEYMANHTGLAVNKVNLQELLDIRPHRLGAETEKTFADLGEVMHSPSMVYKRSKSSDIQIESFKDAAGLLHPNSFNLFESNYEAHKDISVRRGAWKSFGAGLKNLNNTYAATFATEVKKNIVLARLRHYDSTEQYLLQEHKIP